MKAPCPYYAKCSGCTLQHLPYVKQLYDKTKRVRNELSPLLARGDDLETAIDAIVASPEPFGYRTSTKLCLHENQGGERLIGLYERRRKNVVAIPKCPVHHPAINALVAKIFGGKNTLPAPCYDHGRRGFQRARLKFLTVRHCPVTGSFGLVLSHTGVPRADLEAWAKRRDWQGMACYEATLTREDEDLVLSRDVRHLAGEEFFPLAIAGRVFQLDPLAFFQANHALVEPFIAAITGDLSGSTLWDLYGGYGSYTFAAAQRFKTVHLVEANDKAIAAANRLGDGNVVTHAASVETFLATALKTHGFKGVSHIIVNPPRGGLSAKVRKALMADGRDELSSLTYVSCNPETLRRDLFDLVRQGGYRVRKVMPFDMFPHTDHVELVVKLEPGKRRGGHAQIRGAQRPVR